MAISPPVTRVTSLRETLVTPKPPIISTLSPLSPLSPVRGHVCIRVCVFIGLIREPVVTPVTPVTAPTRSADQLAARPSFLRLRGMLVYETTRLRASNRQVVFLS